MLRFHLCALALAATALLATAAAASGSGRSQPTTVTPFATGLTNPRHVGIGPDGNLYAAEAGVGGTEPAVATPGRRVADGLPSAVDNSGESLGPSDLAWLGGTS